MRGQKDASRASDFESSGFILSEDIRNSLTLEDAANQIPIICAVDCSSGEVPAIAYSHNLPCTYSNNDALNAVVNSKDNEKISKENNEANKIESRYFFPSAVIIDNSNNGQQQLMEKLTEDEFHPSEFHADSDTCYKIRLCCLAFDLEVLLLCCAGLALSCAQLQRKGYAQTCLSAIIACDQINKNYHRISIMRYVSFTIALLLCSSFLS